MVGPEIKDSNGKIQDYATVSEPVIISSRVGAAHSQYVELPFTVITEIRNESDLTVYLQVVTHETLVKDTEGFTVTNVKWQPDEIGKYLIAAITVSNLTNPEILTWLRTVEVNVLAPCGMPSCRVLGNDTSYREHYRSTGSISGGPTKQQSFTGLFTYVADDKCQGMKLVRCTPYKLDGKSIYAGSDNLDEYLGYVRIRDLEIASFDAVNLDEFLGHRVEIVGKIYKYNIDGPLIEEIIPIMIRIVD